MNESKVTGPGYRLAAKGRQEAEDERLALLEQLFDPVSQRRRNCIMPGWRCLEVGAGRGSMAAWLAQQVGADGHVVATDIDVRYLDQLNIPNVEVRRHNILEDSLDALGLASFDLVSSRLMLFWLPDKQEEAIRRMTKLLRPGGWLVDEDGDWGMVSPVESTHPLYRRYQEAWQGGEWWAKRGYDPFFGRKLPAFFERCGLQNIGHEANAEVVQGGSAWAQWWKGTLEGIRAYDEAEGSLTEAREHEYQALSAPLDDQSVWLLSELLHSCWGQRFA
jgi:SAM-dependent methyltransferase